MWHREESAATGIGGLKPGVNGIKYIKYINKIVRSLRLKKRQIVQGRTDMQHNVVRSRPRVGQQSGVTKKLLTEQIARIESNAVTTNSRKAIVNPGDDACDATRDSSCSTTVAHIACNDDK